MSSGYIDDRKSAKPEARMVIAVDTHIVRSTVQKLITHCLNHFGCWSTLRLRPDGTTDPTHAKPLRSTIGCRYERLRGRFRHARWLTWIRFITGRAKSSPTARYHQ